MAEILAWWGDALASPATRASLGGVLGLLVGSFLNVVIHRLPRGESIVRPGSRCPGCGHAVRPWDNLPVVSWLWLRGRCRDCAQPISGRYPAVELFCGLVFAAVAWRTGVAWETPVHMAFAAALVAAAMIDFDHQIIPDEISLGGLCVGLVVVPALAVASGAGLSAGLLHAGVGAFLGAGLLWTVAFTHARLSVAMGREFEHWPGEGESLPRPGQLDYWTWFPGMGFGDVKLMAMIGAFLGPAGVVLTILGASLAGLGLGAVFALARGRADVPFGFGPAIALGALIALLVPFPAWLTG